MNKLIKLMALMALVGLSGIAQADGGGPTAGGGHTLSSLLHGGAHPNDGGTGGIQGGHN